LTQVLTGTACIAFAECSRNTVCSHCGAAAFGSSQSL
jgi:hypothetical protein